MIAEQLPHLFRGGMNRWQWIGGNHGTGLLNIQVHSPHDKLLSTDRFLQQAKGIVAVYAPMLSRA